MLGNLPSLPRLTTLILSNNLISSIAPRIANAAPRLTTLVLTSNRLSELSALLPLARFPCLEYLACVGNEVTRKEHYRAWVISRCKKLRVLDFRRIRDKVSWRVCKEGEKRAHGGVVSDGGASERDGAFAAEATRKEGGEAY